MSASTTAVSAATQKLKVATIAAAAIVVSPIFNGAVFPTETEGWTDRQKGDSRGHKGRQGQRETELQRQLDRRGSEAETGGSERQRQRDRESAG